MNKRRKKSVKTFFCRGNFRPFLSNNVHIWDHFFLFPQEFRISKFFGHLTFGSGGKRLLSITSKVNKFLKTPYFFCCCRGNLRQFLSKKFKIWDHSFSLLFPKNSESLKSVDIRLWDVGANRRLNGTSKINRRTHLLYKVQKIKS